jgi:hypothetical protein
MSYLTAKKLKSHCWITGIEFGRSAVQVHLCTTKFEVNNSNRYSGRLS